MDYKRNLIYIARDTYGVRPLFIGQYKDSENNNHYAFTSVMKQIVKLDNEENKYFIKQFLPGHLIKFSKNKEHNYFLLCPLIKNSHLLILLPILTIRRDIDVYSHSQIRSTFEFLLKKEFIIVKEIFILFIIWWIR